MSKRRAGGGIKAAFAKQAERAEAAAQTAAWLPAEAPLTGVPAVPDEYLQEVTARFETYLDRRDAIAKAKAKSSKAALLTASQDEGAGPADQHSEVAKWQAAATFCIQQLSRWPGSGVALQLQQQEALLHIVANADLHLDPLLSSKAYSLLQQNLAKHPPVQLAGGSADDQGADQPPVVHCTVHSNLCWGLFNQQSKPLLPDAPSPFQMLQQLVQNAVQLVTGRGARSSSGSGGSGGGATSSKSGAQGQALLLLYVVQLLQADLLVRQVACERYLQLATTVEGAAHKAEACNRAAIVLQHSLLYRIMQDDSVGGDSWRYVPDSSKGKHQLVRDLLLLVSTPGKAAGQPAGVPSRAARAAAAAAAAGGGEGDTVMQDAYAVPAPAPASQAAAAAACPPAGSMPEQAPSVSAQELIQAARVLLLLLLQLFSSCEEAGVYGRAVRAATTCSGCKEERASQTTGGFELDEVLMTAIGSCGGRAAAATLPHLDQHSNLQRLLLALPAVHRVRLLCLMVASVIHNRVVEPEREGKLAQAAANLELQGLEEYLQSGGRGCSGFRLPSAVLIMQAVDARLEWAAKEMFGGKVLFPFIMGTFISSAAVTLRQAPAPDKQAFVEASTRLLDHVVAKGRDAFAIAASSGHCEAVAALADAKQQLQALAGQ